MTITPTPLQAPGTPAIILPSYKAPAFTAATVAMGGVVTTVTFEDVNGVTPFTFGQVFKIGDICPTDGLVGRIAGVEDVILQVDVKATHKDGSVRHAIISGFTPSNGVMYLIRSVKTASSSHAVGTKGVDIRIVEGGVEYHAYNKIDDNKWLNGAVVVEYVGFEKLVTPEGIEHPFLTVQINERVYSNGQAKFDVVVEHTRAYQAVADITYDIEIGSGSQVMYSKLGLAHFPCTRYKKTFWQGGKPNLHIKHNTAYLISTKAIPSYDTSVVMKEATLAGYEAALTKFSFEPMATGRFQPVMSAPGGRPDIGLAPDCYAATIISMDKRAKALMLASADVGGSWAAHRRDVDGSMLDVIKYPYATILGNLGDTLNPLTKQYEKLPALVTTSKLEHDCAHQPAFAYIPYLLTGDYYYLEELQFWCNYNAYSSNPYYRFFEKGWIKSDQLRGQGWSIRTLAEAEYITPDNHPQKPCFKYWLDCSMEYYRLNYTDAVPNSIKVTDRRSVVVDPAFYNELGVILTGPTIAYTVKGFPGVGISLYMDDFFTQAVGHAVDLGCDEAARLLKWKSKFQVGRLIADGYCPNDAAIYNLRIRDTNISTTYYTTLKQCRDNTKDPAQLGCDPVVELTGYPLSTEGFPSNYQPALAYAVDSGYEGGDRAWNIFMSRKTKPDYGTAPQFAIVPRKEVAVDVITPPPETKPPVVVPPVVVPPVIVIPEVTYKVVISNSVLASLEGMTVLLEVGAITKVYTNQSGNTIGEITISDKPFITQGMKFTATVLHADGYLLAKIFPVIAI